MFLDNLNLQNLHFSSKFADTCIPNIYYLMLLKRERECRIKMNDCLKYKKIMKFNTRVTGMRVGALHFFHFYFGIEEKCWFLNQYMYHIFLPTVHM